MLDYNKLLYAVVATIIVIYLGVGVARNFDFSKAKELFKSYFQDLSMADMYNYLDNHKDYYYEIEGSTYCITKEELTSSGEISDKFITNMKEDVIEATYQDNAFVLKYNENCVER